jgi:23S rRNA (cytidine2498-2'-O)-methyltransferase
VAEYIVRASDRFAGALRFELGWCRRLGTDTYLYEGDIPEDPVFVHKAYRIEAKCGLDFDSISKSIAEVLPSGKSFAIECQLVGNEGAGRAKLGFGSREIEVRTGKLLESSGFIADLDKPDVIVEIVAVGNAAYISILEGSRRNPHGIRKYLNRAEKKFIEAYEVFGLRDFSIRNALDIGAAPGGFSKAMAELGISVVSVDPGELDPILKGIEKIRHEKVRAENFKADSNFDIITDDMNMHPVQSARIAASFSKNLEGSGLLLMTVKCPTRNPVKYMEAAMAELEGIFRNFRFKHLESNKSEVMMLCEKI